MTERGGTLCLHHQNSSMMSLKSSKLKPNEKIKEQWRYVCLVNPKTVVQILFKIDVKCNFSTLSSFTFWLCFQSRISICVKLLKLNYLKKIIIKYFLAFCVCIQPFFGSTHFIYNPQLVSIAWNSLKFKLSDKLVTYHFWLCCLLSIKAPEKSLDTQCRKNTEESKAVRCADPSYC